MTPAPAAVAPGAPPRRRLPLHTASWVLASLVASTWPVAERWLALDLRAAREGQLWRLVTGHLVHGTPALALVDLGALALLGWLLERRDSGTVARALPAAAVLSSLVVLLWRPDLARYEGSSALSSALLVALACDVLRDGSRTARALAIAALTAFLVKCGLESAGAWPTPVSARSVEVLASAHLAGGAAGWLAARAAGRRAASPTPS